MHSLLKIEKNTEREKVNIHIWYKAYSVITINIKRFNNQLCHNPEVLGENEDAVIYQDLGKANNDQARGNESKFAQI